MASYKLQAIDNIGGQGIAEHDNQWILISLDNFWEPIILKDWHEAERIVRTGGFIDANVDFESLRELISSLRKEWTRSFDIPRLPTDEAEELLKTIFSGSEKKEAISQVNTETTSRQSLRYAILSERKIAHTRRGTKGAIRRIRKKAEFYARNLHKNTKLPSETKASIGDVIKTTKQIVENNTKLIKAEAATRARQHWSLSANTESIFMLSRKLRIPQNIVRKIFHSEYKKSKSNISKDAHSNTRKKSYKKKSSK